MTNEMHFWIQWTVSINTTLGNRQVVHLIRWLLIQGLFNIGPTGHLNQCHRTNVLREWFLFRTIFSTCMSGLYTQVGMQAILWEEYHAAIQKKLMFLCMHIYNDGLMEIWIRALLGACNLHELVCEVSSFMRLYMHDIQLYSCHIFSFKDERFIIPTLIVGIFQGPSQPCQSISKVDLQWCNVSYYDCQHYFWLITSILLKQRQLG